jgi:hypothetical protein
MWLYVDSPQHYFIENLLDYRGFVTCIQKILERDDSIVFSSYGSRRDIRALLEDNQLEPDKQVLDERERLSLIAAIIQERSSCDGLLRLRCSTNWLACFRVPKAPIFATTSLHMEDATLCSLFTMRSNLIR